MVGTTTHGIAYPDSLTNLGNLAGLFAGLAQSVDDALPVVRVSTIQSLNVVARTAAIQFGVISADQSGMWAGATFVQAGTNGWRLISPIAIDDYPTFKAALDACPNVDTMPGVTFRLNPGNNACMFTDADGGYIVLEDGAWTNITYPSGRKYAGFGYQLAYKLTRSGIQLRGTIARSTGTFAASETIFTLPAEARPTAVSYFIPQGTVNAYGNCQAGTDGAVVLRAIGARTSPWYSFDGITIPL